MLLDIKTASLKMPPVTSVSSWKLPTMVTYCNWLKKPKNKGPNFLKNKFGTTLFKSLEVWKLFMTSEFVTEISNVLTYSWQKTVWSRWVILMYLKLLRKAWCIPKLELLTMLVQKFGKISHMTTKVTFGVSVVSSMKWLLWCHHSELPVWLD